MLCLGRSRSQKTWGLRPHGFGLGTSLGTTITMIPPRLFQIMSQYVTLPPPGFPLVENIPTECSTFAKSVESCGDFHANLKICGDFHNYFDICGDLDANVTTKVWCQNATCA